MREQGGYERLEFDVRVPDEPGGPVRALTYVATPDNANYLGPAPLQQIAAQVVKSRGPSGANVDYVLELERALQGLGAEDSHVSELAEHIRALTAQDLERGNE